MFANIVNRADIRMVQNRSGSRFAEEPLDRCSVAADFGGEELQSHIASQADVFRSVHHAHSPTAQLLDHTIMRHGLTNHGLPILGELISHKKGQNSQRISFCEFCAFLWLILAVSESDSRALGKN